jgi:magnesium-transporting ATPase (P-type)
MSALTISLIAFACIFGGTLIGMFLRTALPEHHLSDESKDGLKLGIGMIATLAALVIGLLLASAKGNFDAVNNGLIQLSGRIILLDRVMTEYGPETKEPRGLLRLGVVSAFNHMWPKERTGYAETKTTNSPVAFEALQHSLRRLSPKNEEQRSLQSRAVQVSNDIAEARWMLLSRKGQSSLPIPFLVILIIWLVVIFFSFGLFSPRNATVFIVLLVCALSVTGALYLLQELDRPFEGLIGISSAPIRNALELLSR